LADEQQMAGRSRQRASPQPARANNLQTSHHPYNHYTHITTPQHEQNLSFIAQKNSTP